MTTKTGVKYDQHKLRFDLVPVKALEAMVDVLTHGAEKYSPDNWRHVDDARNRYFAAAQRHLWASRYEEIDADSGRPHLACAMCCLSFMLELQLEGEKL